LHKGFVISRRSSTKLLYDLGVISGIAYKNSKSKADELTARNNIEGGYLDINHKAMESQVAGQKAKVDEIRALRSQTCTNHE